MVLGLLGFVLDLCLFLKGIEIWILFAILKVQQIQKFQFVVQSFALGNFFKNQILRWPVYSLLITSMEYDLNLNQLSANKKYWPSTNFRYCCSRVMPLECPLFLGFFVYDSLKWNMFGNNQYRYGPSLNNVYFTFVPELCPWNNPFCWF